MFKTTCCGAGVKLNGVVEEMENLKESKTEIKMERNKEPDYALTYFNAKIGGEAIRFLFHLSGISFHDNRIEDGWQALKPTTKWQKLPILEFNGISIYSYSAILRYLAKQHGLHGSNDIEDALCDEYFDACQDLRAVWSRFFNEEEESKKKEFKDKFVKESFLVLTKFNEIIEGNKEGPWLVGKTHLWIDLVLVNLLEVCEDTVDSSLLENYSALKKLKDYVFSLPEIKKYIENRPKTSH